MKLGVSLVVLALAALVGCGARQPAPATSTTHVTSAEVTVPNDAPRSGKQQKATTVTDDEAPPAKDGDRRPGGGFSGYK